MRFLSFVLKNLTRRPFRSGMTLLALATAVASVVALLGIAKGFVRAFEQVYATHSVDVVVSRQGSADRLSSSVDEAYVEEISEIRSVARAAGVLLDSLSLEEQQLYGLPTMGIAPGSWLLEDYQFTSRMRSPPAPGSRQLMLGTHLAERVGVRAGDSVMLFEQPYRVTAVFRSRSTWENGSIILPLADLQSITDRSGQVTYVNVVLERTSLGAQMSLGEHTSRVLRAIEALDPKLLAMTTNQFVSTDTRMRVATSMAWMTSVVALLIGGIGTLNTMMTSVLERTTEIGILRAIGWPRWRVAAMIVLESLALAVGASVLGMAAAYLLTQALGRSAAARGVIDPAIDLVIFLQSLGLAVGIGLLGALLPAWRATRLMPALAIQDR